MGQAQKIVSLYNIGLRIDRLSQRAYGLLVSIYIDTGFKIQISVELRKAQRARPAPKTILLPCEHEFAGDKDLQPVSRYD
jgi:hypothetical protein